DRERRDGAARRRRARARRARAARGAARRAAGRGAAERARRDAVVHRPQHARGDGARARSRVDGAGRRQRLRREPNAAARRRRGAGTGADAEPHARERRAMSAAALAAPPSATSLGALVRDLRDVVGAVQGDQSVTISGVNADSRTVAPGALFVALPGTRTDGARYVAEAI